MPPRGLCEWETVVSSHMPHLSKPQVKVLALYSFAMAMTRSLWLDRHSLLSLRASVTPAVAGVELRCRGQGRQAAAGGGSEGLFCSPFALGTVLVDKHKKTAGVGLGR
ncbi:MAG: hypothetical protein ACUVWR_03570 [Anaerolineae bacterium]